MAYRVFLVAMQEDASEKLLQQVIKHFPSWRDETFPDARVFVSDHQWSCLSVSTRSCTKSQFLDFVKSLRAPTLFITTNELDNWRLQVWHRSKVLVDAHMVWACVDPEEREEETAEEVVHELESCRLINGIMGELHALSAAEAWDRYFEIAETNLASAMREAGIDFDAERFHRMFVASHFEDIDDHQGSHLGYFVNECLGIALRFEGVDP